MKKNYRLTEQAINILKMPEMKLQLMLFFEITDTRTIDSYLANNKPNGPLMNVNIRDLILEYAPFLTERCVYHKLSDAEREELNPTKSKIKRKYYNNSTK